MGLDAVVFKGRATIEREYPARSYEIEPGTFDWNLVGEEGELPLRNRTACNRRIGNLDMVCNLRAVITSLLPPDSIILNGVLYNAFHCGDWIQRPQLMDLAEEVRTLQARCEPSLKEFVESMQLLLAAADREETTIVFG